MGASMMFEAGMVITIEASISGHHGTTDIGGGKTISVRLVGTT